MGITPETLIAELKSTKQFFDTSTRCLTEDDSAFVPAEGMWTVAQQVAHTAQTVDWFFQGAFRPEGFDMDWEKLGKEVSQVRSLGAARAWLDAAFARAIETIASRSAEEVNAVMPPNPILGEVPRAHVVSSIVDHTAHHRGALTVYSRLLGRVPAMPYMEEPAEVTA
ncbi:MAG TPA: DinB family protein [Thermoanaerobaculia bacterium]|nr:DinB family protein [Thermoanaerobaculia bacterium]